MSSATRWEEQDGIAVLRISALEKAGGVSALFTGRAGGISPAWNNGLNWSHAVGDRRENVQENRRRTLALLGISPADAVMAWLVHGDRVVAVGSDSVHVVGSDPNDVSMIRNCDALITDQRRVALVITAADCVPVYLYDPVKRAAGLAHAGWRGTVAGIAGKTARAMVARYGCEPGDVLGVIGPSIGPCCYEVDDAVVRPLREQYGDAADGFLSGEASGKYHLDLWEANRHDLVGAGLQTVSVSGECTACSVEKLFSHRAESGRAGRGAAVMILHD